MSTTLRHMYLHGEGVTTDTLKAAEWFQKAADKGDATAQNNLAWLYAARVDPALKRI